MGPRQVLFCLCLLLVPALGFYLPGVAPQDYAKVSDWCAWRSVHAGLAGSVLTGRLGLQGDKVVLKVNKLTSTKTQLPYEYYSMPYCRPEKIMPSAENLGEVLRGDRIENSPFEVMQASTLQACY